MATAKRTHYLAKPNTLTLTLGLGLGLFGVGLLFHWAMKQSGITLPALLPPPPTFDSSFEDAGEANVKLVFEDGKPKLVSQP